MSLPGDPSRRHGKGTPLFPQERFSSRRELYIFLFPDPALAAILNGDMDMDMDMTWALYFPSGLTQYYWRVKIRVLIRKLLLVRSQIP
jgi:hypothetical protein